MRRERRSAERMRRRECVCAKDRGCGCSMASNSVRGSECFKGKTERWGSLRKGCVRCDRAGGVAGEGSREKGKLRRRQLYNAAEKPASSVVRGAGRSIFPLGGNGGEGSGLTGGRAAPKTRDAAVVVRAQRRLGRWVDFRGYWEGGVVPSAGGGVVPPAGGVCSSFWDSSASRSMEPRLMTFLRPEATSMSS